MSLHKQGFTLIELLTTILIIGILVAIALPEYKTAVYNSRLSTVMTNVKTITDSLDLHYMSMGQYPVDGLNNLDIGVTGCAVQAGMYICGKGTVYAFDSTNEDNPVAGFLGEKQGLAYIQYPKEISTVSKRSQRECWADASNEIANRVCLNLEGVHQGTNSWRSGSAYDHSNDVWNVYILP